MRTVVVIFAVGVAVWILWYGRNARRVPRPAPAPKPRGRRRERYTQAGVRAVPKPGDNSPLTPALSKAIDRAVPAPTAGEAVPHDEREVRGVMEGVLRRVNNTSDMQLALVSVDSVLKTVDRFKTLRYEANINVYSKSKSMASKLAASVDVTASGKTYVRELRVHGAAKDVGGAAASNGVGFEEKYAEFEPAVRY